jgi:hypothetical protein
MPGVTSASCVRRGIIALCDGGDFFSGQRFAMEMVINGLKQRNWEVKVIKFPVVSRLIDGQNRHLNLLFSMLKQLPQVLAMWIKAGITSRGQILYVVVGQTPFSMIREGVPVLLKRWTEPQGVSVVSLHGSIFLQWEYHSLNARLLRFIAAAAQHVTVLSSRQVEYLALLGVDSKKLMVMDNTCLLPALSASELKQKHLQPSNSTNGKIHVLYLSSLIEDKGYIQFVEAIAKLAQNTTLPLEVTLCGRITFTRTEHELQQQFSTVNAARLWIESKIAEINCSKTVSMRWVNGATGSDKENLFKEAHIFILPSQYRTEAQPIVLLEALASGCAIITSRVGEIPATVSEETAILLDICTADSIANAIQSLTQDDDRIQMALRGINLFQDRFSYFSHIDRWERLLS